MVIWSLISVINLCDSLNVDVVLYVNLTDNMFLILFLFLKFDYLNYV